jgi:hypothetical protein
MNGDITRSSFRPERHFSAVRSQQGRVQLDADWNEQVDIAGHRDRAGTEDVLGRCGGPWAGNGFEIGMMVVPRPLRAVAFLTATRGFAVGDDATILTTTDAGSTWTRQQAPAGVTASLRAVAFTATRGFAVGDDSLILVTDDAGTTWDTQPPPAGTTAPLRAVAFTATRGFAVGDDSLFLVTDDAGTTWDTQPPPEELAVSAGRLYVGGVLCENERPVAVAGQPDLPGAVLPSTGTHLFYLDVWQRPLTVVERPELREVALGGPDTTTRTKTVWQVKWEEAAGRACADFGGDWVPEDAGSSGRLAARAVPSATVSDPCLVPPGAGYRRLENQCYRVEIHTPGPPGTATYKWSRDNGSVASRVDKLDPAARTVTIADPGKDAQVGFASAEFAELTDERLTLLGLPGTLVKVALEGNDLVVASGPALPTLGAGALARRWESAEVPVTDGRWEGLEAGVQVRFTGGEYRTGDYWLIPARTLPGTVDWPVVDGEPVFEGRRGIAHGFCPLAVLELQGATWALDHDCRRRAPFLTDLTTLYDVGGQGQESLPGDPLPQLLQVASPVPGAAVRFSTTDGGVVGRTKGDLATSKAAELTVVVDERQIASCAWKLRSDGPPSQLLEATLIDAAREPIGRPVRFAANLSRASEVSYDGPQGCQTLTGAGTVQQAIDALAQAVTISYVGGDGQEALPGTPLPKSLQVAVTSPCGLAAGVVRFTTSGQGRLARTAAELPTAKNIVEVKTVDGIASCAWMLDRALGSPSQQAEGVLLDGAGNPVGTVVRFAASHSLASLVAYDPKTCANLAGAQTVQQAIDRLCTTTGSDPGIHITGVRVAAGSKPLHNDTVIPFTDLEQGILVECNQKIDPFSVTQKPTFSITVDRPFPITPDDREFWKDVKGVAGFEPLVLAADVKLAEANVIGWFPREPARQWLRQLFVLLGGLDLGGRVQARLTLEGNFIWAQGRPDLYLDGDAFGEAGGNAIGLRLPSGDGRRGGDFQMWFFLGPEPTRTRAPGRRGRSTSTSRRRTSPPARNGK